MMKNLYFTITLFAVFISFSAFAQPVKRHIKGKLTDEAGKPVDYATIAIVTAADSSVERSTVSGKDGSFDIADLKNGSYRLVAAQLGLKTYTKAFSISNDKPSFDFGTITMIKDVRNLKEVAVTGEKVPVVVKKDTVEFNAGSFKTQANDNVEALLKKIPSLEVDKDGKITSGGKDVKKIMVDGREFFGGDPKAASK